MESKAAVMIEPKRATTLRFWRIFGQRIAATPERLFLFFGTTGGAALFFLIPPLFGGNETFQFQRVASIAAFHLAIEPAKVPSGIVRLIEVATAQFPKEKQLHFHYSFAQFDELASIPLGAETPTTLEPNAISVHNPVSYIPQVAAYWFGEALGLTPLSLFYLARFSGLVAGIGLTFFAIRRMPVHQYGLCALALLPTIVFFRSALDADQVTTGLCFLFVANILTAAMKSQRIRGSTVLFLATLGLLTALCKSAYFVLLLLAFAVPVDRYGSRSRWLVSTLVIMIPGLLGNVAWTLWVKQTFFAGIQYHTWGGDVRPDEQLAMILAEPTSYVSVLARTIFLSPLLPTALIGILAIFGPPVFVPPPVYTLLVLTFGAALVAEGLGRQAAAIALLRSLAAGIFFCGFGLILFLLYIQWTGVGAPIIQGFYGRYLFPLLPPLLLLLPARQIVVFNIQARTWVIFLATVSIASTLGLTWMTYWI
jgi:uncharacterized membrane protein